MKKPNANGKILMVVLFALIFAVAGFIVGNLSKAATNLPGSADDPVATQSYVETVVGERLATLTTRIEELEAEVASLKGTGATAQPPTTTTPTTPSTTTPSTPTTSNTTDTLTVTGNTLRVRAGAGTGYEVLASLSKGDTVTKLGTEGDWYRIKTSDGTVGYISSAYAQ